MGTLVAGLKAVGRLGEKVTAKIKERQAEKDDGIAARHA
jgi:hypothetical protein